MWFQSPINFGVGRKLRGLLMGGLLVFGFSSSLAAQDSEISREEIIKQVQNWRNSFATIRVQWKSWRPQLFAERYPDVDPVTALGKTHYLAEEFVWADWGAYRYSSTSFHEGQPTFRDAMGTPGDRPWSATTKHKQNLDQWDHIQLLRPDPARPLSPNIVFKGVFGLWNKEGWFGERLSHSEDFSLAGLEDVNGSRCVVVRVVKENRRDTYWLDPGLSCLPRRYMREGRVGAESTSKFEHWSTWSATQFRTLSNGSVFPARGTFQLGSDDATEAEWVVDEVVLNESLPRSFFEAPHPESGTRVTDYYNLKAYSPGGAGTTNMVTNSTETHLPTRPGVTAKPRAFPWSWAALVAGVVLAGGVILRWWQRSRQQ